MIHILLPCYNEYQNLIPLIKKINKISKIDKINILLVNDGSIDETHKKLGFLRKISKNKITYINHKKNQGLNIALLNGFNKIISIAKTNDIIFTLDSDNTHPVSLIPKMSNLIKFKRYDIVIASRFKSGGKVKGLSSFRTLLSIGAKLIFNLFININNVDDYTCNFRAYKYDILKKSNLINKKFFSNKDFSIAADLLININKRIKNLRIFEVPLVLRYDNKIGESKMNVGRTILKTLNLIIRNF